MQWWGPRVRIQELVSPICSGDLTTVHEHGELCGCPQAVSTDEVASTGHSLHVLLSPGWPGHWALCGTAMPAQDAELVLRKWRFMLGQLG